MVYLNDTPSANSMCKVLAHHFPPNGDAVYVDSGIWIVSSSVSFDMTINCEKSSSQVKGEPPLALTYVTLQSGCQATSPVLP